MKEWKQFELHDMRVDALLMVAEHLGEGMPVPKAELVRITKVSFPRLFKSRSQIYKMIEEMEGTGGFVSTESFDGKDAVVLSDKVSFEPATLESLSKSIEYYSPGGEFRSVVARDVPERAKELGDLAEHIIKMRKRQLDLRESMGTKFDEMSRAGKFALEVEDWGSAGLLD